MDSQRFNPMAAASFASAAALLLLLSGRSCSFLTVVANPGQVLMNQDDSLPNVTSTTLGIFCSNDRYNFDDDPMQKLSYVMTILSLTLAAMAVTLSWGIATCFRPSFFAWKAISVLSALAAVLQVPIFLLFQTPPCADNMAQQHCTMDQGSFLLVGSIVCSVTVTLITQCLDPPVYVFTDGAGHVAKNQSKNLDDTLVTDGGSLSSMSHSLGHSQQHTATGLEHDQQLRQQQQSSSQDEPRHASTCSTNIFGSFFQFQRQQVGSKDPSHITQQWKNLSDDDDEELLLDVEQGRSDQQQSIPFDDWAHFPRGADEFEHGGDSSRASTSLLGGMSEHSQQPPQPYSRSIHRPHRPREEITIVGRYVEPSTSPQEPSASANPPSMRMRLYSWEDEEEEYNIFNCNNKRGLDISGTDSILDGTVRGDESILDTETYLEDWTVDEVVVKVVKREGAIQSLEAPPSPASSDGRPSRMSRVESILSTDFNCTSFSMPPSERSAMSFSTTNSSQPPRLKSKTDPPTNATCHEPSIALAPSPAVTSDGPSTRHSPNNAYQTLVDGEYDHFLGELQEANAESLDPPPMETVTLEPFGDGNISLIANDTVLGNEVRDRLTSWNELHGVGLRLPASSRSVEHSVDTSHDEDESTYYSDPDLTLDDSASEPTMDSPMSHDEYSQAVVSEVLRRQKRRKRSKRKHRQGSTSASVQSAPSLLDTTIHEETPSDVESEEEKKCDEPYDPYVTATGSLSRSVSVPNLQSQKVMSPDPARMLEMVQMDGLNKCHRVETWCQHEKGCPPPHDLSRRTADDEESSGGGVSESKFPDTPERKSQHPMPLFREERILRKDLRSVIAMSESTEETVENTSDESDPHQIPQQARQVRLQRLQDSRLRAKHFNQMETPLSRLRADDGHSMVVPAFPVQYDASESSSVRSRPRMNSLENHHLSHLISRDSGYRNIEKKADPDGIQLTPSFEGSI